MLREINKRFELGLDPYSFDVLRNNQTISDTLDELSIKFPELFALLDKEVNVSTCLTNIQWGCESGHPTLNDKIFWPTGQEAYKRVFKSLDHAPGGEPDMDYCVSISPPSALGYFGKFVTSNQISQSYWTTPDHVSVETRSHFDSTHGSCLEQKVGFHMDTDYSGSWGGTPLLG